MDYNVVCDISSMDDTHSPGIEAPWPQSPLWRSMMLPPEPLDQYKVYQDTYSSTLNFSRSVLGNPALAAGRER